MKKNTISISESDLRKIVSESVKKVLNEIGDTEKGQRLLGMAGARRAEKDGHYNARGTWDERDAVGGSLPGNTTSDVPIYKHAAKEWGNNPKLKNAFEKGVQKQYKKMTGNKNGLPPQNY